MFPPAPVAPNRQAFSHSKVCAGAKPSGRPKMANGVAVALSLVTEPTPADSPKDTPTEITLGEAVAAAATAIVVGIYDYQYHGELSPDTKDVGSRRLAKVTMMALASELGDHEFFAQARAAGKTELLRLFPEDFNHTQTETEMVLDGYIDVVFELVGNVLRDERAMAN